MYEYDVYTGANHAALTHYGGGSLPGYSSAMLTVTTRGNATATMRYLDTAGSYVSTYRQYDVFGNVLAALDGTTSHNATTYAHSGSYNYGFPTTISLPTANGITQSTAVTYDLSLGKPTQLTEQYAGFASGTIAVSSAHYGNNGNDLLDRLSSVTRGTGSTSPTAAAPTQTAYGYNDQPGALEVDTCQDLNTYQETSNSGTSCSGGVKTARLFDGFGQPVEARTYESGTGYISTQTVYDGLERVYTVTNPFRPASESPVLTKMSYDAAGRVVGTTTQDGSTTTRTYTGSTTQVQTAAANAEGSVTHSYVTDALGRMTQVNEDPSGVNFVTGYKYTALDQLTKVTQGVQTRNFITTV